MLELQTSAYASTYEIVEESTPPVWLSLREIESESAFAAYIRDALSSHLLSDFQPEEGLSVEKLEEPDIYVSTAESALLKKILLSSVRIIED